MLSIILLSVIICQTQDGSLITASGWEARFLGAITASQPAGRKTALFWFNTGGLQ